MEEELAAKVAGYILRRIEQRVKEWLSKGEVPLGLIVYFTVRPLGEHLNLDKLNELIEDLFKSIGRIEKSPIGGGTIIRLNHAEYDYELLPFTLAEMLIGEQLTIYSPEECADIFERELEEISSALEVEADEVYDFTLAIAPRNDQGLKHLKLIIPQLYDGLIERVGNSMISVKIEIYAKMNTLKKILKRLSNLKDKIEFKLTDRLIVFLKPSQIGQSEVYDALVKIRRIPFSILVL